MAPVRPGERPARARSFVLLLAAAFVAVACGAAPGSSPGAPGGTGEPVAGTGFSKIIKPTACGDPVRYERSEANPRS